MSRKPAWVMLVAALVLVGSACDENASDERDRGPASEGVDQPSDVIDWGCDRAIPEVPERPPPGWRDESIVVGDFGFYGMAGDFHAHRPHERSDLQVKLPVASEGRSAVVLWIPDEERERAGLILSDVPRRGPGNSYLVDDGHTAVRFEPCRDATWTAWVAGLALADRGPVTLMVREDGASAATPVELGPWKADPVRAAGALRARKLEQRQNGA